jgi:glycosyltransferase involved in cell wall biosynthesis
MRVAFNFDVVLTNRFAGLYTYGIGLLRGFSKLADKPDAVLVYSKRYDAEVGRLKVDQRDGVVFRPMSVKRRWLERLWRYSKLPSLQWFIGDFDIYHCLYNHMPPTAGRPRILTVHDLRRYKLPELYKHSKLGLFELAVERADHFIAVSQSTKNDLCQIFGIPQNKVDVIYLAADERLSPLAEVEKSRLKVKLAEQVKTPLDKFVMVLSSGDTRKNIERTIRAFKTAGKQLPNGTKLVVVGRPPKDFAESLRQEAYSDENVIWTGPVDNLTDWLGCADVFVYASLYEGFGIPILEAFACGVPVIASNCSSMPEVAGDAAMLVDPYDEQAISQTIVDVYNNEKLRSGLIEAGNQRQRQFSWDKTALKTIEVYKKLAAGAS